MKRSVRRVLKLTLKAIADILIRAGLLEKMIIIRMDGGICSQMHFYLIGGLFEEKGYKVKYDLLWFKETGVDLTGRFPRNFDLTKAFPYLAFSSCTSLERFFYRVFHRYNDYLDEKDKLHYLKNTPPVYMDGYYLDPPDLYGAFFRNRFTFSPEVLNEQSICVYNRIIEQPVSVAVHVRRGDLSQYNVAYGEPVGTGYFSKAIDFISGRYENVKYFFFSDEPSWVENELLPNMAKTLNHETVSVNGSDRGYMDMFLISSCTHQITSKGSLGKYGAFINNNPLRMIIVYDDPFERSKWEGVCSNIVFLKG